MSNLNAINNTKIGRGAKKMKIGRGMIKERTLTSPLSKDFGHLLSRVVDYEIMDEIDENVKQQKMRFNEYYRSHTGEKIVIYVSLLNPNGMVEARGENSGAYSYSGLDDGIYAYDEEADAVFRRLFWIKDGKAKEIFPEFLKLKNALDSFLGHTKEAVAA